jgi:hypothetical protein
MPVKAALMLPMGRCAVEPAAGVTGLDQVRAGTDGAVGDQGAQQLFAIPVGGCVPEACATLRCTRICRHRTTSIPIGFPPSSPSVPASQNWYYHRHYRLFSLKA